MNTINYFYAGPFGSHHDQINDGISDEEILEVNLDGMSKLDLKNAIYLLGRGYRRYKDRMRREELVLYYAILNLLCLITFGEGPEMQRRETLCLSQRSSTS